MVEASSATTGVSRTPSTKVKPLPVVLDTTVNASEIVVVPTAKAVTVVFPKVEVPVTPTVTEKVAAAPAKVPETVGEAIVGEVPNTTAPDPVSPVTAAAKLAVEGVARKVATPVPSPEIPVETGRPVALVTAAPVPVSSVRMGASSPEVSISAVVIEPEAHDCHSKFEVPDS